MKIILFALCLFAFSSCSSLSESFTPVTWGSGAYVAVPLGDSSEDTDEGVKSDVKEGPSRKLSSEEEEKTRKN